MADNVFARTLSPPSEKGSSGHNPTSMASLSTNSSIFGGASRTYIPFAIDNNKSLQPLTHLIPPKMFGVLPFRPIKQVQPQVVIAPAKRPRGRPPGSRNKPKMPVVIVKEDTNHLLKPIIIEIPNGVDVIATMINFARNHDVNISVLSASGFVSQVTLRDPFSNVPTLSLCGHYHVVHLSGSYISSLSPSQYPRPTHSSTFGIQVAGNDNRVSGGLVGGRVIAAGPVVVVLSKFKRHEYNRLTSNGTVSMNREPYATIKNGDASDVPSGAANNITNMVMRNVSAFGVTTSASNSSQMNIQLPVSLDDAHVNMIQWNNPIHHNNN